MARFDLRTGVPRSQSAFRCYAAGKRRFKLIPLLLPEPVPAKGLGERAKRGIKVKKAGDMVAATMITKLDSTDSASLKQIAKATQITSKISERNEKQMVSSASTHSNRGCNACKHYPERDCQNRIWQCRRQRGGSSCFLRCFFRNYPIK